MANNRTTAKGSRSKKLYNSGSTKAFTSLRGQNYKGGYRAATDVQTGFGRASNGKFSSDARVGSKAGRGGKVISRRQRYYDMRLAFGLNGG